MAGNPLDIGLPEPFKLTEEQRQRIDQALLALQAALAPVGAQTIRVEPVMHKSMIDVLGVVWIQTRRGRVDIFPRVA